MNKILSHIKHAVADINAANRHLSEIQTDVQDPRHGVRAGRQF